MRVLAVDDHPLILVAMRQVLATGFDSVDVTGATTLAEGRSLARRRSDFDLVLLGIHLPDGNGLDLLHEWRGVACPPPVIVLTGSDRMSDVVRAIDEGAAGFVSKRATPETLLEAIRVVMEGGVCFPPLRGMGRTSGSSVHERSAGVSSLDDAWSVEESSRSVRAVPSRGAAAAAAWRGGSPAVHDFELTPRQHQVFELLIQGKANKVIARELGLSVETIKDHVAAILRTVGVASRQQVLAMAVQQAGGVAKARG